MPGGCAIGARPVNLHLDALTQMGAKVDLADGYVAGAAPKTACKGAEIVFPSVSVGATETALMAATLARGTTVITNAAREPEIDGSLPLPDRHGRQDRRAGHRPSSRSKA